MALLGLQYASTLEQYIWCLFSVTSAMIGLGYGYSPSATWPEALTWWAGGRAGGLGGGGGAAPGLLALPAQRVC